MDYNACLLQLVYGKKDNKQDEGRSCVKAVKSAILKHFDNGTSQIWYTPDPSSLNQRILLSGQKVVFKWWFSFKHRRQVL